MRLSAPPAVADIPAVGWGRPIWNRAGGFLLAVAALSGLLAGSAVVDPTPLTGEEAISVRYDKSRLSVRAHDAALGQILFEISRQTGLALHVPGPLPDPQTVDLTGLPLRKVLGMLLADRNFVLRPASPGVEASLWVLQGAAASDSPDQACEAIAAPDALDREECRREIDAALHHEHPASRLAAVELLVDAEGGGSATLERLAGVASSDAAAGVREEAIYGLSRLGQAAVPALERLIAGEDRGVRSAAVEALTDVGGDAAAWALAAALDDPDRPLRESALYALADIGGEISALLLERALGDDDGELRELASELLTELGEKH